MNLSTKPDETPPVLLSHQSGASYFSVRALRPDASAAINVILRGQVIALSFSTGADPDRTITFTESASPVAAQPDRSPARLIGLLDQAARYEQLAAQYPALAQQIEHQIFAPEASSGAVSTSICEAFRFESQAALILRARIENRGAKTLHLRPAHISVAVGSRVFPITLTDVAGDLPANTTDNVWLVLTGDAVGLSLKNTFRLALAVDE